MNGKIIQKGTGYCVGEINGNNMFVNTEFFDDKVLDAIIVWDKDNKKTNKNIENKNFKMVKDNDFIDMEHHFVNEDEEE